MKNATQPAVIVTAIADRDYKSGDLTQIGSLVGVIATDAKAGEETELATTGGYEVKADPSLVAAVEDFPQVDIDVANKQVVEAGTGDNTIGVVIWKDANTDVGFAHIRFDGVSVPALGAAPAP